jgi:hypothetical protein
MKWLRYVANGVRGQGLILLCAAVLALHLLLLLALQSVLSFSRPNFDSKRLVGGLLSFQLLEPSKPTVADALAATLPAKEVAIAEVLELPSIDTKKSSTQAAMPTSPEPAINIGAIGAAELAPANAIRLHDGQMELDFQLADIQGVQVQLGTMMLRLAVQAGQYEAQSRSSMAFDNWTALSQGAVDTTLQPAYYSEAGSAATSQAVDVMAQDPLSIVWSLRSLVATAMPSRTTNPTPEWVVPLLVGGGVHRTRWTLSQIDYLLLPGGGYRAVKVAGSTIAEPVSRTNIWYALDYEFLPVRIETVSPDGRVRDAKLRSPLASDQNQSLEAQ